MRDNIDKALARDANVADLADKSDALKHEARREPLPKHRDPPA